MASAKKNDSPSGREGSRSWDDGRGTGIFVEGVGRVWKRGSTMLDMDTSAGESQHTDLESNAQHLSKMPQGSSWYFISQDILLKYKLRCVFTM